jgi:hypothetical protein
MNIDDKFEIVRDEGEHKNNCLHKEIKELYEHYLRMGFPKIEAIRYAKWNYRNLGKKQNEDNKNRT